MYRFLFRPRWIAFHLVVVAAIVAMLNLGLWQLRRLDDRQHHNAVVAARYDQPAVPIDELVSPTATLAGVDAGGLEWLPVTAVGTYTDSSILIVNRSQHGRPGQNVVTPMRLADGRILLVNRGFLPLDVDAAAAPAGTVTVSGRLRLSQTKGFGQLSDAAEGPLATAQRVDIARLAPQLAGQLAGAVVPMYVDAFASAPPEAAPVPEPVIKPELDEGPHLGYAIQWFVFSIAVAVGWVLAVRRSIATRRHLAD